MDGNFGGYNMSFRPAQPNQRRSTPSNAAGRQHQHQHQHQHNHQQPKYQQQKQRQQQPNALHLHARTAAAEVFDKVRSLVDNVSVAFDGPAPTAKDKLVENWTRIQEYYTRQDDLRRLQIGDTTIPHHMECMLKILAEEMLHNEEANGHHQQPHMARADAAGRMDHDGAMGDRLAQPLEFGPCVEFLLQYHVLSDLVDLADADLPRGMRKYVLRFFGIFIDGIPLGLLPESAIRLPLVAIMRQCLHVVQTSPTTPINPMRRQEPMPMGSSTASAMSRLGQGYHSIQNDKSAVILCHDLLQLIVTLFKRLREHSSMVYLFFDWESNSSSSQSRSKPRAKQQPVSDLAMASLRTATSGYMEQSARGHELFIVHIIVEYLLAPGFTGQLAREALVLVVQVLLAPKDKARYVSFLLDQARLVELLVEHMGYLHSQFPMFRPMPRSASAQLFNAQSYHGSRRLPPVSRRLADAEEQRRTGGAPRLEAVDIRPRLRQLLTQGSVLRSVAQQDQREAHILVSARQFLEHVDAFFLCWELLDEIAFVGSSDTRLCMAVQSQLVSGFLRTHIEPALLMAAHNQGLSRSQVITTISYLSDLIGATHSTHVLDAVFMVLLGTDLSPETRPGMHAPQNNKQQQQHENKNEQSVSESKANGQNSGDSQAQDEPAEENPLSPEDMELLESIEDDALRAEAAALLLPPGCDISKLSFLNSKNTAPAGTATASSTGLNTSSRTAYATGTDSPQTLRALLISWMSVEDNTHLSLNAIRLFDTILGTMNQFAYTNLVLRNFLDQPLDHPAEKMEDTDDSDDNRPLATPSTNATSNRQGFYSGPALGLGVSVAADQELVRAVVERFLDATPSSIAGALPESVVAAAMRLEERAGAPQQEQLLLEQHRLEAPRNFQNMRSLIMMRESQGCDEYVNDCLRKLRFNHHYTALCWQSKEQFVRSHSTFTATLLAKALPSAAYTREDAAMLNDSRDMEDDSQHQQQQRQVDAALAGFYPGAFLASLITQLTASVRRHMAYNLMVTSMINKLACLADPALCAYLFLANSATVPRFADNDSLAPSTLFLYDAYVGASAEAYVKSEHVPRFSARLARQHREGVETAVRVGAAHPMTTSNNHPAAPSAIPKSAREDHDDTVPLSELSSQQKKHKASHAPATHATPMDIVVEATSKTEAVAEPTTINTDSPVVSKEKSREDVAKAAEYLGTPIKRFVHGYIVLDEFGKEMAATALALHTVEMDWSLDNMMRADGSIYQKPAEAEEYADLLEYYDPAEPAYRQAMAVKESLRPSIIDLGPSSNQQTQVSRNSN
ncbi:hypothetical protein GGI07_005600 [Coemansia sp. Benny D115]|nr:hypothetical protein GGI07_005600 [Coemansia sp. Benny D115]